MPFLARFRALPDKDKASLVRKLMENGTPDFDYFYLIGLSTVMASLGLLLDSGAIVIGSMLIAPLMYPVLGVALGLVMMGHNIAVLQRAFRTLTKSLGAGLFLATIAAFFFANDETYRTSEVLSRIDPNHLHLLVALVAGAAVAYMLARPEWGDALPGVAISVALIPPLATMGIGIAEFDAEVIRGATMLLLLNLFGIIAIAVIIFLLMNLGDKQNIAESTIKREEEKLESETKAIAEVTEQITVKTHTETDAVIIEDRIVEK